MGWFTDVSNNGFDAGAAQAWVNQKKEEEWAAAKEEERRQDRVNERESYSYDPAPAPAPKTEAIDKAKEAAKAQSQSLKETVTGSKGDTGSSSAEGAKGFAEKISYQPAETPAPAPEPEPEPIPEPEPEPTPTPTPTPTPEPQVYTPEPAEEAVAAAERRAERQAPAVSSYVEDEAEKSSGQKGWSASRSKGEPVVYTGGTAGTIGMKRSATQIIAAQTKNEITGEDDNATILQKYWAMSPEEQAEQVGNPRVQAALRAQANQQAAGNRGNGYLPSNPLYSEGFSTRGDYDPRATRYTFNGQLREVGVENNRPYDRPLYPAAQNDQRAAEYLAAWQRRNADIQQQLAMQNYQYDPLQAAILRANAGLGGSGLETRGYDPGIRLAGDQQYLADNGFSWAGNPSLQSEDRGGTYVPPTAEGQEDYDTQVRILKDRGYSQEDAERMAAEEFGNYTYSGDQPSYVRRDVPQGTANPGDALQSYIQEGLQQATAQGLQGNEAQNYAVRYANERMNVLQNAAQMTPAEAARRNPRTTSYYYEPVPGTGTGSNYYAGPAAGTTAGSGTQTPATTPATTPTTGGQSTGNGRPGADAALNDVMNGNGYRWVPDSVRLAQERGTRTAQYLADQAAARSGQGTTGTSGNGSQAGSESSAKAGLKTGNKNGSSNVADKVKEIMDKALKLKPTYGQGGQVVKAPYRKGGYTEDELKAMGNNAYGKSYGSNAYEGYYKAPDGNYYPVDQIKANYYKANRNSYRGWEEPMREYYNNFGTFFGYRPDWKTAGGVNVWKQNRPASGRSYGGGGSGSAPVVNNQQRLRLSGYTGGSGGGYSNYGRGSTANNGIYYNPNTSWSI